MAAIVEHRIRLSECGASTGVRYRAWQCSTRCPIGSKWLFLPAVVDKFFSGRRGWNLRLVHTSCRSGIVAGAGSARQSLGGVKDRRESTGTNTFVWRQMLDGVGPDHVPHDGRQLRHLAELDQAVPRPPLGRHISGSRRRGDGGGARAQLSARGSPGVPGIRFVSRRNAEQCSLRSVSERVALEYKAGLGSNDLQCSHRGVRTLRGIVLVYSWDGSRDWLRSSGVSPFRWKSQRRLKVQAALTIRFVEHSLRISRSSFSYFQLHGSSPTSRQSNRPSVPPIQPRDALSSLDAGTRGLGIEFLNQSYLPAERSATQ